MVTEDSERGWAIQIHSDLYFKILGSAFLVVFFLSAFLIREPREHPKEAVQLCKLLKSTVFLEIKKYGDPYLHAVQSLLRSTEYFYISFM